MKKAISSPTKHETALVTGGAGFIGSHLVERLLSEGYSVKVVDNFSTGTRLNLKHAVPLEGRKLRVHELNCTDAYDLSRLITDVDLVFHCADQSSVRATGLKRMKGISYMKSVLVSQLHANVKQFFFLSSSTVYGRATVLPTPEDYGPLTPISFYGASKLASEGLVSAFCNGYDRNGIVLRLANVVGPRCHGVVPDIIGKLLTNSKHLELLGDGQQSKSYLHVDDCVDAIVTLVKQDITGYHVYNLGSLDQITVNDAARSIADSLGVDRVELTYKRDPALSDGAGWLGDVDNMWLDIRRIMLKGWSPKYSSAAAVKETATTIMAEMKPGKPLELSKGFQSSV